jgi:WD40 repeat protein
MKAGVLSLMRCNVAAWAQSVLLAADYEGCLSLWDAEAAACTATFEEHLKRVWSADFSQARACT